MGEDEEEDAGFFQRHKTLAILIGLGVLGAGIYVFATFMGAKPSSSRQESMTMVMLPPPPPPPPPKPTPPPPDQPPPEDTHPEQKMIEQAPVKEETKPAPAKVPQAPGPLTNITGQGGPDMGLGFGNNGGSLGNGSGVGGPGGSKYGWYASQVQNKVADALRNNPRTRRASLSVTVRIWPDSAGRVTRAELSNSTGDTSLDTAIRNDVLTGLQLSDPPPPDMPLPIVMRLSARRPR